MNTENKTSNATHTPGPWKVFYDYQYGKAVKTAYISTDDTSIPVATTDGVNECGVLASAQLIAAAPDLLAALCDAEFLMRQAGKIAGPMQDSFNRSADDARQAIAKAKGEA